MEKIYMTPEVDVVDIELEAYTLNPSIQEGEDADPDDIELN